MLLKYQIGNTDIFMSLSDVKKASDVNKMPRRYNVN